VTALAALASPTQRLQAGLDGIDLGVHTVEVPGLEPDFAALESLPDDAAWRWAPPDEPPLVALGLERRVNCPAEVPPGRRAFGARAFFPQAGAQSWAPFGDAWFFLPRWELRPGRLSVWLDRDVDRSRLAVEGAEILRRVGARPSPTPQSTWAEDLGMDAWRGLVSAALAAISDGQLAKVVVARTGRLHAASAICASSVASRVIAPGCTHYFLRIPGGPSFFGATPERLVSLRGREVRTEALAGTAAAGDEAALLASGKDLGEHRLVVQAIEEALRPLCRTLTVSATPEAKRLLHLVHLRSEIRGWLDRPLDILDLVTRLHPTPATGGTPRAEALAWLAAHEPGSRGLYAGPIGWFDSNGDGDFSVALRCALVDGNDAYLFAGAGLVRGSEAGCEWAETVLKRRALSAAFGVEASP